LDDFDIIVVLQSHVIIQHRFSLTFCLDHSKT